MARWLSVEDLDTDRVAIDDIVVVTYGDGSTQEFVVRSRQTHNELDEYEEVSFGLDPVDRVSLAR